LRKLLDKRRHLDERFILEEDKKLYKEKQDQGNTRMNEKLGIQPENNQEQQIKVKGGKKEAERISRSQYNSWEKC